MREFQNEIKLFFQDNKRRDEERTRFQNVVFDMILRSRNPSNVGSQSYTEKCSIRAVDFDNTKARVCESVSLPYECENKVPNSEVYSLQKTVI
ncbi:hypothetical protein TorRG33x02_279910, partial [Trema orientale]